MPAIIVIGASAGGIEAVSAITGALPADFQAAVFIVIHIGAHQSALPWLLNQSGKLRAEHPKDGDWIQPGRIYVAPPNHHLVIEPGYIRLTKGPRENWARPAIDPLFRSAAQSYGTDVIGVILTGGLSDGTAGLYEVKQAGGIAVVQDPADAACPGMPQSALAHVAVDHCLPIRLISDLLVQLVQARTGDNNASHELADKKDDGMTGDYQLDKPIAVTCPDCGGALHRTELGSLVRYGCHIGHVYSAEVMMEAQFVTMERHLEAAMRSLSERGELCRQRGEDARDGGKAELGAQWDIAMSEAKGLTTSLKRLLQKEWTHPAELK